MCIPDANRRLSSGPQENTIVVIWHLRYALQEEMNTAGESAGGAVSEGFGADQSLVSLEVDAFGLFAGLELSFFSAFTGGVELADEGRWSVE